METATGTKSKITLFDRVFSIWEFALFQYGHCHYLCIFASSEQEPVCCARKHMRQRRWCTITAAEMQHPLSSSVWPPETFSKHWWLLVGSIFSTQRNLVPDFCFINTSMSDVILSDCPSAAICCKAIKCNGILVRRFNLEKQEPDKGLVVGFCLVILFTL